MNRFSLIILLLLLLCTTASDALLYRSLSSTAPEILIDDGRIIFVQPDQSLTILDAGTGAILARERVDEESRGLFGGPVTAGSFILVCQELGDCWVFDRASGRFLYRFSRKHNLFIRDEQVLYVTRDEQLALRDLATNTIVWGTTSYERAMLLAVTDDQALLYSSRSTRATLVLIKFTEAGPIQEDILNIPFSGMPQASWTSRDAIAILGGEPSTNEFVISFFDYAGNLLSTKQIPSSLSDIRSFWLSDFSLDGIAFIKDGRFAMAGEEVPATRSFKSFYALATASQATQIVTRIFADSTSRTGGTTASYIRYGTPPNEWCILMPTVEEINGSLVGRVYETEDMSVMMSASQGFVVAFRKNSDELQWSYLFPIYPMDQEYLEGAANVFDRDWEMRKKPFAVTVLPYATLVNAKTMDAIRTFSPVTGQTQFDNAVVNTARERYQRAFPKALLICILPGVLLLVFLIFSGRWSGSWGPLLARCCAAISCMLMIPRVLRHDEVIRVSITIDRLASATFVIALLITILICWRLRKERQSILACVLLASACVITYLEWKTVVYPWL